MKPAKVIPEKVRGYKLKDTIKEYSEVDTILYALGVGVSRDPMDLVDLDYTYERSDNFKVLPTFGVTLGGIDVIFDGLLSCPGIPDFNPMMLLYGEHKIEILKPFPKKQKVSIQTEITDVADKVKGALVTILNTVYDEKKSALCKNTSRLFIRGLGGFGDKGLNQETIPAPLSTPPHKSVTDVTLPSQAILYRLAGDFNPLHISPDMAALGGFDRPILHGMCFFAIAGKAVLREFCGNDITKFKSMTARFTSHVFPGETLVTEMWCSPKGIIFQQKTQERGKVCSQGLVEISDFSPKL